VIDRARRGLLPLWTVPLALLSVCVLAYGLMIPWLGFYWDDWAFIWISQRLGSDGLQRYFATNRPVWGLIFQATTALLGSVPWHWQVFGIFWRWVSAVAFWAVMRLTWPRQQKTAAAAALILTVYPAFNQQPIAITYGHFFIVFCAFLFSLAAMLAVARGVRWPLIWTGLGALFSLLNLVCMEYFFLLDLLRPMLLWLALAEVIPAWRGRLRAVWRAWVPYLVVFVAAVLWRTVIFGHQTQNYQLQLLADLRASPASALAALVRTILVDLWEVTGGAWAKTFHLPDAAVFGTRTMPLYTALVLSAGLIVFFLLHRLQASDEPEHRDSLAMIAAGAAALLVAGWPFWLTYLPVGLSYPNSRFAIPFLLGAVLLVCGLAGFLPQRFGLRSFVFALLVAAAVGMQFQEVNEYRRDWNVQKQFFWQMAWRIPRIEANTALLTNDLPTRYTSDNSLTSPLNWIYAPETHGENMPFVLYFVSIRKNTGLRGLRPDQTIMQPYLAADFTGNTSQTLALVYSPPACLRVLDPEIDAYNPLVPPAVRQAVSLSRWDWIIPAANGQGYTPPEHIYGAEPAHNWCYYYEKAELARQSQDWKAVVALGDEAFKLDDYPNDPAERFPFIEAYAHTGDWDRALALSRETAAITPLISDPLCRLWDRIAFSVLQDEAGAAAIRQVRKELLCAAP